MNTTSVGNWTSAARQRTKEIQNELIEIAAWAKESGADEASTALLLEPYSDLLDRIYERDISLAKLVDQSDLLLHVRGPATGPTPRVSAVTYILTKTRDQVTRLAKQMSGLSSGGRVPAALDLGFVGVATGSLFVGFTTDTSSDAADARSAVDAIAYTGSLVERDGGLPELAKHFQDPAIRDIAVAAIRSLSPSGQIGIKEIDILGRGIRTPIALTTNTRRHARALLAERLESTPRDLVEFVGTVREVDLDAARFEIRNVAGSPYDIRCAHELDEDFVKKLMDKRVRVKGSPEYAANGVVRLLWIEEVELLT